MYEQLSTKLKEVKKILSEYTNPSEKGNKQHASDPDNYTTFSVVHMYEISIMQLSLHSPRGEPLRDIFDDTYIRDIFDVLTKYYDAAFKSSLNKDKMKISRELANIDFFGIVVGFIKTMSNIKTHYDTLLFEKEKNIKFLKGPQKDNKGKYSVELLGTTISYYLIFYKLCLLFIYLCLKSDSINVNYDSFLREILRDVLIDQVKIFYDNIIDNCNRVIDKITLSIKLLEEREYVVIHQLKGYNKDFDFLENESWYSKKRNEFQEELESVKISIYNNYKESRLSVRTNIVIDEKKKEIEKRKEWEIEQLIRARIEINNEQMAEYKEHTNKNLILLLDEYNKFLAHLLNVAKLARMDINIVSDHYVEQFHEVVFEIFRDLFDSDASDRKQLFIATQCILIVRTIMNNCIELEKEKKKFEMEHALDPKGLKSYDISLTRFAFEYVENFYRYCLYYILGIVGIDSSATDVNTNIGKFDSILSTINRNLIYFSTLPAKMPINREIIEKGNELINYVYQNYTSLKHKIDDSSLRFAMKPFVLQQLENIAEKINLVEDKMLGMYREWGAKNTPFNQSITKEKETVNREKILSEITGCQEQAYRYYQENFRKLLSTQKIILKLSRTSGFSFSGFEPLTENLNFIQEEIPNNERGLVEMCIKLLVYIDLLVTSKILMEWFKKAVEDKILDQHEEEVLTGIKIFCKTINMQKSQAYDPSRYIDDEKLKEEINRYKNLLFKKLGKDVTDEIDTHERDTDDLMKNIGIFLNNPTEDNLLNKSIITSFWNPESRKNTPLFVNEKKEGNRKLIGKTIVFCYGKARKELSFIDFENTVFVSNKESDGADFYFLDLNLLTFKPCMSFDNILLIHCTSFETELLLELSKILKKGGKLYLNDNNSVNNKIIEKYKRIKTNIRGSKCFEKL
jgi:hypothetical protein